MVIRKGEAWGRVTPCPTGLEVAPDDASLAALVAMTFERAADATPDATSDDTTHAASDAAADVPTTAATARRPPLGIAGGDLHRTLGAPGVPQPGAPSRRLPVDLLRCELDGVVRLAVAHVVVRRPGPTGWWRGPILALCNAQFHGRWDVAPRGHPNDGRADLVEVAESMTIGQRRLARRRLPSGTHIPHPDITTGRVTDLERELAAGLVVHLDHRPVRGVRHLRVTVVPDAFDVHV